MSFQSRGRAVLFTGIAGVREKLEMNTPPAVGLLP